MIPISPSNLAKYRECPYHYSGIYVTKQVKYPENEAMRRGSMLHSCLEQACKQQAVDWPAKETAVLDYCLPIIGLIHRLMDGGWTVHIEHEAAVNADGSQAGWWQADFLRSKIDVAALSPGKDRALLWDWKSGKTPGNPDQFYLNAFSLVPEWGAIPYEAWFVYFDQKRVEQHSIKLPFTNLALVGESHWKGSALEPLVKSVRDLKAAWVTNDWPKTPNRGCRWCLMDCEYRGR